MLPGGTGTSPNSQSEPAGALAAKRSPLELRLPYALDHANLRESKTLIQNRTPPLPITP